MTVFYENGSKQIEDRDPNYVFEHLAKIDLNSKDNTDPITEYLCVKGLQLNAKTPQERIPLLRKCLKLLDQCNVEGFNHTREASIMYHTLGASFIDQKKWKDALVNINKSAELEMEYLGTYTPPIVACQSSILYQLGRYQEVIDLISQHTETFDPFSKDALMVHQAYSLLKLNRMKEVRAVLDNMKCDADQVELAKRNLLIKYFYQTGKTEVAITEYENLARTSRDRKYKGLYDYFFDCLKLLGQFLRIRKGPIKSQRKLLKELRVSIVKRMKSKNTSNTEDYLYDWLLTEIGKA